MSPSTDPPELAPETAPDGHLWYVRELCQRDGWWTPPDPADMQAEYPAWRLPAWYEDRTGCVAVPGLPGLPGTTQYVFGGWLPWQAGSERYVQGDQWPDAEQLTVADMQAALGLLPPTPEPVPAADPAPELEPLVGIEPDAPPLTPPTLGQLLAADPEGN